MSEGNRLVIKRNGSDHTALIVSLLTDIPFTEREMEILRILVRMNEPLMTQEIRRQIKEEIGISRENLNNMLIRMQAKGIFDKQWRISRTFGPLFGFVDEIVVKLK